MRSRSANKSWPQRFLVNVPDCRREVRALHTRSLALLLHRQRKLNHVFVHFYADVPENTATSVRCSTWRSSTGTSESTFGFLLELETLQLESHCSRDAVFSRRLHQRLRFVEWCLVQPHRWFLFGWLIPSLPNIQLHRWIFLVWLVAGLLNGSSSWSSATCTAGSWASIAAAVLVFMSFASHQLSNHIPDELLRFLSGITLLETPEVSSHWFETTSSTLTLDVSFLSTTSTLFTDEELEASFF